MHNDGKTHQDAEIKFETFFESIANGIAHGHNITKDGNKKQVEKAQNIDKKKDIPNKQSTQICKGIKNKVLDLKIVM